MTAYDTIKMLKQLKKDHKWFSEVNSQSLQHSLIKLDVALHSFFNHNTDYPNFRSKKDNQYFIIPANFKVMNNRLFVPKFQEGIEYRDKLTITQEIKQIIVTRDVDRYYASIQYESSEIMPKGSETIGIDLGLKSFATLSNGIQIENPHNVGKVEKRIKRQQKKLSRKVKGSNNRRKQIVRIQRLQLELRDKRMDFNHKVSTAIANPSDTVVMEDLNVQGMMKNHNLARAIGDVSWHRFEQMLKYKAEWRDIELIEIGRFEPSSKMCAKCGNMKHDLKLSDRTYHCDKCGLTIDRDLNAAINIRNMGLVKVGRGTPEFTPVEIATSAELFNRGGLRDAGQ